MNLISQTQFTSTYPLPLDDKKRLTVPFRWREADGKKIEEFFGLYNKKRNSFVILPAETFNSALAKIAVDTTLSEDQKTRSREGLTAQAVRLVVDKNGRVGISGFQEADLKMMGIKSQVVLVGGGDRFRIMSPEQYQKEQTSSDVSIDQVMQMIGL